MKATIWQYVNEMFTYLNRLHFNAREINTCTLVFVYVDVTGKY